MTLTGQELKILFKHDKAYLTKDKSMTFNQLDLPEFAKKFKSPSYFTIIVEKYKEVEKKIFCGVISYHNGETEFEYNQKQLSGKLNDIQIVAFRNIDTLILMRIINGKSSNSILASENIYVDRLQNRLQSEKNTGVVHKQNINKIFFAPLEGIRFKNGEVSFDKRFEEYEMTLKLTITNHYIKEEFDAVKNYFANVLKTKKVKVIVNMQITGKEITLINVNSPEIEKIDEKLIEKVKLNFIESTIKKKSNVEIDKSLFTMEEYFDAFADEGFNPNIFYTNAEEFFEDLLTISNTKHYEHLKYLSNRHSHKVMKLRFIPNPFSFIFLMEGNENYYYLWETLDTKEATYVWQIEKDIDIVKQYLGIIENTINTIKAHGKKDYISSTQDKFKRIYHDYSDLNKGFLKWKRELEGVLI